MKPVKIIFFDGYPYLGGGQTVLLALVDAARQFAEHVCVAFPTGGPLEEVVRARFGSSVEIVHIPEMRFSYGRKELRDFVRMAGYMMANASRIRLARRHDLLYVNAARYFLPVALLSALTGRKACYHLHLDHSKVEKWLIAQIARLPTTALLVANSTFTSNKLVAAQPKLSASPKLVVVENALPAPFNGISFVDRFTSPPTPLHVAVIGVLRPEKGQDIAVALARTLPEIHLHLIGRPGEGAEDWVARLRAEASPNVTFHGPVTDVPATIGRIGVHVNLVPSRWEEPFGMVAIEGMACSCVTVVRDSGALPDIAAKTGAIIYKGGLDDLLVVIRRLLATPAADLGRLAYRQFDSTTTAYGLDRFVAQVSQMMAAVCH